MCTRQATMWYSSLWKTDSSETFIWLTNVWHSMFIQCISKSWLLSNENYVQIIIIKYCELPSKADTIWDFGGSLRPLGLAIVLSDVYRWWWWCQRQWFCGSFSDDSDGRVRSYTLHMSLNCMSFWSENVNVIVLPAGIYVIVNGYI